MPNNYSVYATDGQGKVLDKVPALFYIHEKSSCFSRLCLPGDCRGFAIKAKDFEIRKEKKRGLVAVGERPFKCTCLCLGRPEMIVSVH